MSSEDTGPTREEWEGKTWWGKVKHNFPAWRAYLKKRPTQWWTGSEWQDEARPAPDYIIVNIEHPMRIKPGCTVRPVELRIVKEDGHAGSDAT